MSEQKSASETY